MKRSPLPDSPVFREARPGVSQPDSPWNMALGIAVAIVLGVIVFASLSNGRQARAQDTMMTADAPAAAQPAPAAPPAPVRLTATPPTTTAYAPTLAAPATDAGLRWRSPALVVDLSSASVARPMVLAQNEAQAEPQPRLSAEEAFASRVTSGRHDTARASRLRDLARIAPQGTMIPAVLETAINSDLPGSVRAVVSQDVRGFDGSTVLIPRGSKLIGQYRSGVALGQSRAFVVWSRILTPDGVSIDVGSPATDPLGRGGLEGETDTHFFQRFGGAILLSVMSAGVEALRGGGDNTSIIIGSPEQAGRLAELAPKEIPVTVKVMQGAPLQVFVTRDLDFTGVQ